MGQWSVCFLLLVIVASALGIEEVTTSSAAPDWSSVDKALHAGVADHTYPGCVALVGNEKVSGPNRT